MQDRLTVINQTPHIPMWKRPAVWITAALAILVLSFAASGNKKATAETPQTLKLIDTPSLAEPTTPTKNEQNATATQESKAIRTGDINGNNTTIINGNQYNIIINPTPPAPEIKYETIPAPSPKLPTAPIKTEPIVKKKQPCEDEMKQHLNTVAKWHLLFKK